MESIITGEGDFVEVAHVFPFCLNQWPSNKLESIMWERLRMFWDKAKANDWQRKLTGDRGTEICENHVPLQERACVLGWARFSLKPIETAEDGSSLIVQFH
ncbi:uncharacterized protein ACHE_40129S [Aspergillus chevalieri]|uniref:HNH nuclease domain-containing protein n=1 Tax=Aspergillus chevalieri TaxID=182096 RepID=A0A7R7VN03_ASPCH|nr:uncharacterized protein ACHE_40129S [Aspergillus chevalieri]BCR87565.1 hypothetical protein ACHE_40129S [Aspergillus chevalieri]